MPRLTSSAKVGGGARTAAIELMGRAKGAWGSPPRTKELRGAKSNGEEGVMEKRASPEGAGGRGCVPFLTSTLRFLAGKDWEEEEARYPSLTWAGIEGRV